MSEDFRGFLKEMEETQEGGFIRIKKEGIPAMRLPPS